MGATSVYIDGVEIKAPSLLLKDSSSLRKIAYQNCRFVIKADEYMRFMQLNSLYKSEKQIRLAACGVRWAVIIGFLTLVSSFWIGYCQINSSPTDNASNTICKPFCHAMEAKKESK
ncbi:MAG: hypothetical protein H6939_05200 [Burkholderiales bacterium]|nr:hypothetical protein [Burkholderiales bacterium]